MANWEPNVYEFPSGESLSEREPVRGAVESRPSLPRHSRSESDPSGEPQRESVQVEAIPSRASLTLSDPGALGSVSAKSSPESITEWVDEMEARLDAMLRRMPRV